MTEMLAKNNEVKNKVKKQKKSQFKEICMRLKKKISNVWDDCYNITHYNGYFRAFYCSLQL